MNSIRERYISLIQKMMNKLGAQKQLSEHDVYQEGNPDLLPFVDKIIDDHLLPGSRVDGVEHLEALAECAARGESCLLLLEHYSNFDLPAFHNLLRKQGERGAALAASLVAIAGIKLNEENPVVNAFAQAYSRIVIYPSRSMEIIKANLKDPNKLYHEIRRAMSINHAAMKRLGSLKHEGKIVLVFPAGTRFRPWDPSSKRGVREIASYLKSFDKYCLVSVNGNILRINPNGEMDEDLLHSDTLVFTISGIRETKPLLTHVKEEHHFREDKKQELVDHVMEELDEMHEKAEATREVR